jgi:NADH-quinone oxidoreductase subunit J
MNAAQVIFYCIAAFVLVTAILSVTSTKIFRAAIWLLFALMGIAGFYFWMELEFIAAVQIVVYVGGIVVLIIFSIFLTQRSGKEMPAPVARRPWYAALAVLSGVLFTCSILYRHAFAPASNKSFSVEVADIGTQMLSTTQYGYVLPFEVISMLLLAAMIGCIVIAMKANTDRA